MKKITALLTALALVLGLCACTRTTAVTWQEQYDLGVRYLSEGNYREAIIAFNAAIEIDPRQAEAYIGLADAYEAQGDVEQARQVLEDALAVVVDADVIRSRLAVLEENVVPEPTPGTTVEPTQEPAPTPGPSPTQETATTPEPSPTQEPIPTPGTTVAPTPEPTQQPTSQPTPTPTPTTTPAPTPSVTVTATGIRADSVANSDGYGRLRLDSDWKQEIPAQLALLDHSGTFVLPYQPASSYPIWSAEIYCSDGIVSLTQSSIYSPYGYNGRNPQYFNLDGTPAFVLEENTDEYTDDNSHYTINTHYYGSPMRDGYAVVIQTITISEERLSSSLGDIHSAPSVSNSYKTMIINRNGEVTCELPQQFNKQVYWGQEGLDTIMELGVCGEGLFAFIELNTNIQVGTSIINEGKGYMDATGKTVIDLEGRGFTNLGPFTNGLAWVVDKAGKVGFIDKTGALVIPCIYNVASNFSNDGLAYVEMDGKYGYIDKTGALVIPCIYESASSFSSDGLAYVKMDGKWGYIDKTGRIVIPFEYDSAYGAGGGLASVVKDGKCGLVDYENNVVIPLEYDDISSFEGGVAYAIKDGLVYIIS